jgi:hypothetical protein
VNGKSVISILLMMKQVMCIVANALWAKVTGDNMIFGARQIATTTGIQENGSGIK